MHLTNCVPSACRHILLTACGLATNCLRFVRESYVKTKRCTHAAPTVTSRYSMPGFLSIIRSDIFSNAFLPPVHILINACRP